LAHGDHEPVADHCFTVAVDQFDGAFDEDRAIGHHDHAAGSFCHAQKIRTWTVNAFI
jgi:hypothetical protein